MDPRQSRRQNPRRSSRRITERYLSLLPFPSLSIPTPPPPFFSIPPNIPLPKTDPQIHPLATPHNANLWRLHVHEGSTLTSATQPVAVLEAMKLEIAIPAGEDLVGGVVEKVLVREGEVVRAGENLVLVRVG